MVDLNKEKGSRPISWTVGEMLSERYSPVNLLVERFAATLGAF